ncbi:ABC transporter substrate-binding protein [Pseudonocardia sp. N23]|uniref:ABC transporter substrate-binding protein n=1 Tax=Pseudonocardia sp. N23 TaxID=1987376 RepID=UPI000BFB320F|nr:ABC transporter substrate-binding protein [Pseudonocardia sp. N23]GAY10993.1 branched-chain amino acid ABC transporter, amino acid-binding protein [Pseudonocardia sp. N23]
MKSLVSRRSGVVATVLAAVVLVTGACGNSTSASGTGEALADGAPLTIGVSTVATGPLAINDQVTKGLGAYFAYRNANGGIDGRKVELNVVDSAGTVAGGTSSVRQLLASKPFGLFVLSTAPFTGAQSVLKTDPTTPVFVLANGSLVKAAGLPNAFGMFTDYTTESFVGIKTLADQGKKKIALVYDPTIGEDAAKKAPAEAAKYGAEIVAVPLPATTTNFAPIAQSIAASGADGIVFQVVAQSIAGTMKALQNAGRSLPAVSYSGQLNATTLELGGAALEGMYFSALFPLVTDPSPAVQEFSREITKLAPDAATVLGILGWNTGAMIEQAVKDADADGPLTQESFMTALRGLGGKQVGVLEKVGWTQDVVSSIDAGQTDVFSLYQVRDGRFVKVGS